MNKQQVFAIVAAYVEGWKKGDAEQILETLAPECLIIESHGPTYRGREHVRQWVTDWFRQGGNIPRWDITRFLYAEESAAFEWTFECTGSWGIAAFDGATIVQFNAGLIAYLREYRCTETPYLWTPESDLNVLMVEKRQENSRWHGLSLRQIGMK